MNKTHIVHIIPTLAFGGAEKFLVSFINNASKDFKHSIIILKNDTALSKELSDSGIVHLVQKKGKLSFHLVKDIKNKLKELQPDIVHTHLFGGDVWGRIAAHALKIPVITTEHNINVSEGFIKHFVKRHLKKYSNVYAAPSKAIAEYMKKRLGVQSTNVIRYGIDLNSFKNISAPSFKEPLHFLILGRLTEQKGHSVALHTFSKITDFDWHLDIVGDGEQKEAILAIISRLGLSHRVTLHKATHDVPGALERTDVLLVPSRWEGLGMVVMEAMAAGRLVIGSNTGGISEMVQNKKTGFLVPVENALELQKKIEWVHAHLAEAKKMSVTSKNLAQKEFGMDAMVLKYESLYKKMI